MSQLFTEIPEDAIDESDNEDTHEDTNKHRDRRVSSKSNHMYHTAPSTRVCRLSICFTQEDRVLKI